MQEKYSAEHESLAKHMLRGLNNYDLQWAMRAWCNMLNTKAVLGNKLQWTREEMLCPLCKGAQQNLKHVLSHGDAALKDKRYTERRDGVLQLPV